MFCNLFDSHTHSSSSNDAIDSAEDMIRSAIKNGISGIAITDHVELDYEYSKLFYAEELPNALQNVNRLKKKYYGIIDVVSGVELGQEMAHKDIAKQVFKENQFDFVIGSIHRVQNFDDLFTMDYSCSKDKIDSMMHHYFDDLSELAKYGNYDILGHISFPLRSAKKNSNVDIDLSNYNKRVEEVLLSVIQRGKGIEINTSGLRGPLANTMPPISVIKRYKELGGEIVTIGSDAHSAEFVGAGMQYAMQMLESCNFKYFAFYRDRKPVMLKII